MKKKTIGQKRDERNKKAAETPKNVKSGDPLDLLIGDINKRLGGQGRVYRGNEIQEKTFRRRISGIPSIDYVLCGGPPQGGLIEIGGPYSSGKTTLAIHMCAAQQMRDWSLPPEERKAIGWIALEPFSKGWARENGFFIPYSEEEYVDQKTGEIRTIDPVSAASELEKRRMEQMGITDPYMEISPFVLVEEERGDVAFDAALDMLKSNLFSMIVVDSFGIAKSTKWLEEGDVQDFSDFPREPKMLSDYTARACLALNTRLDQNNKPAADGNVMNETTLIHLNQISTNVGTQAFAPWKVYRMKGGEGIKHNHHAILFMYRDDQPLMVDVPGRGQYIYGQNVRVVNLKSKIGPPFRKGEFKMYTADYDSFNAGDIDVHSDLLTLAIQLGVVEIRGSWVHFAGENLAQGKENAVERMRNDLELFEKIRVATYALF